MSLTIENIKELKNVSATASAYTITPEELKTFDYKLDAPADSVVTKHIITPEIKEQLQYTADEIGIKPYYPSLLKDNNTAINTLSNNGENVNNIIQNNNSDNSSPIAGLISLGAIGGGGYWLYKKYKK